jgi:hypothetical protein
VGPGGSGKSTLAAALGHRVARHFPGGIHWFRVGAWSTATLETMLAVRLRTSRKRLLSGLRHELVKRRRTLIVLDNHDDDEATANLLNSFVGVPAFWIVTARRCLLAGVTVYPVNPPLVLRGDTPYSSVAALTRLLRYNPLSLSVADALVTSGAATAPELERHLVSNGVHRIRVIADEDDLPEVRLLVEWVWGKLDPTARRVVGVLVHSSGDHVDRDSLLALAGGRGAARAIDQLLAWRFIQEPFAARYAVHATVRRALLGRARFDARRLFEHYMNLLEAQPERLDAEQTHLFTAMDYAYEHGNLGDRLRILKLLRALGL